MLGGSTTGLYAALTLARGGHDVVVYERDPAPPADPEQAFASWDRPGTPHLRQSHAFLDRSIRLLRRDHPDLYDALLDAGAHVVSSGDFLPPWVEDRAPRPDDVLTMSARRPVYDWVLHAYAARAGVRVERTGVAGLTLDGGTVPRVTGVRLTTGETVAADAVLDATGRRTRTPKWLADAGVRLPVVATSSCGNRYYTRYYRVLPGVEPPRLLRGFSSVAELDACAVLVFRGDGDTYSVSIQTDQGDEALRVLRDPRAFAAAAAAVPVSAAWTDPAVGRPIGEPSVMAGLHNTVRRTVAAGRPVVTGLLLVGDAAATSNPSFGRGVSLGMVTAELARDALAHGDPDAQALDYDAGLSREVEPFVENARRLDSATNARWRHALYGAPPPDPADAPAFEHVLVAAMRDRDVFNAMAQTMNLLRTPESVTGDPDLMARVAALRASGWTVPAPPLPGRVDVVAAATAAVG